MRKNYLLFFIVLMIVALPGRAQQVITAMSVDQAKALSLSHIFKRYTLFDINTASLSGTVKAGNGTGRTEVVLELPGYATLPISIYQQDILSSNYELIVGTPTGRQTYPKPACMTYAGNLTNDNGSGIYLTITDDLICGMIKGNGTTYLIEPLRYFDRQAGTDRYVVYEAKDVIPHTGIACAVTDAEHRKQEVESGAGNKGAGTATGTCRLVEVALASDDSMLYRYGTAGQVQEHNIAIWNIVTGLYSNAQIGTQYLEFKIKIQYVATSAATNPLTPAYTGADANTILSNFTSWGQASNFGTTYDVAGLFTARDLTASGNSGIIGLAWVGATCTSFRYQIIEDYAADVASLGTTVAHETGHNLGANHDAGGAPYIMAPSISSPPQTVFSPASLSAMSTYITGGGGTCFSACNATIPTAQFNSSPNGTCTNSSIGFKDYSTGQVLTRSWSFPGGTPSTSTADSVAVTYATPGLKTITLTVTNSVGSSSISKTIFAGTALTGQGCRTVSGTTALQTALISFRLAGIGHANNPFFISGYYNNNSCSYNTVLSPATSYVATVNIGYQSLPTFDIQDKLEVYIDYNNDGDFLDPGETAYTTATCQQGIYNFTITTPAIVTNTNTWLRLRVISVPCTSPNTNGCAIPGNAAVEDYAVYFAESNPLPVSLLSFTGHEHSGKNELYWQSATETNNDYYIVQRSIDGTTFSDIGRVAGHATVNTTNSYHYTDDLLNVPHSEHYYYRLKMVAYDGGFTYSRVVTLQAGEYGTGPLFMYPNPVDRGTVLHINTKAGSQSAVSIFNSLGQLIMTRQSDNTQGSTDIVIPANWTSGLYLVKFSNGSSTTSKLVMVR